MIYLMLGIIAGLLIGVIQLLNRILSELGRVTPELRDIRRMLVDSRPKKIYDADEPLPSGFYIPDRRSDDPQ